MARGHECIRGAKGLPGNAPGAGSRSAVPDSAWDVVLAAVHSEAARLPDSLRLPFVLCCLEGRTVAETAALLGWKPGTLTGRLSRAKQALMARLEARGLSAGAIVAATAAGPAGMPVGLAARVAAIARPDAAVTGTVLSLSQGVASMTAFRIKLIAAAALVAGGLTTTVGFGRLVARAAAIHDAVPRSISFTGALQSLAAFQPLLELGAAGATDRMRVCCDLLDAIATHRVGGRPDRYEPRLKKRRWNHYDWLTRPRAEIRRGMARGAQK